MSKFQRHPFPNNDSFSTFTPRLPLFWLDLIFCHSPQFPPILTTDFICCFSTFVNLFLHHKLKIHVKLDIQPIWQQISFLLIYFFLLCFYFLILNNQELWSCDRPRTRSCDRPGLHIPGRHFWLLFFCQLGMHGLLCQIEGHGWVIIFQESIYTIVCPGPMFRYIQSKQ